MNLKYHIAILLFAPFIGIAGQIEHNKGNISGFEVNDWYNINIDSQIIDYLRQINRPKDQAFQFALPVNVSISPANSGDLYENGDEEVWITGIRSKNASSLNLILEPFSIPAGAYVYIYSGDRSVIRGAFTSENNNISKILPTMPVPGEEVILEYHFPRGRNPVNDIGISQVAYDYLGIFGPSKKDGRFNQSQACNIDINCPDGNGLELEKRAVCRIIVRGSELCTGVLLNNTNQQNRPILVTARHCITDQNDASKSVFVFGYESPWCDGPDGSVIHSLSGSLLQSANDDIDFSLVELSSFPPITYKPYLAGWDVSGTTPQSTAVIHHPQGDVKKISRDLNAPVSSTLLDYLANGFWKILQWDSGTTEGGSSGAPLFDQNKRVVGLLSGGEAVCGRSVNDYFAKLSVSYSHSQILWEQLKGWIDPARSGVQQLNGRDPYASNWIDSDTLSNILHSEITLTTPYPLPGRGYSTGYNSDSLVNYAEYFTNPGNLQVSEIIINTAKVKSVLSTDSARVYIYADGTMPGQVLASQGYRLGDAKDSFSLKIDFVNAVPVGGNFYVGWRLWYKEPVSTEERQFAVFHSPDRINPGLNTAWFNDGSGWRKFTQHPFEPMSVSLDVKVVSVLDPAVNGIEESSAGRMKFVIYPNPVKDRLYISSPEFTANLKYSIVDINGKVAEEGRLDGFPGDIFIDVSALNQGFYLLLITADNIRETYKILKIK